MRVQTAERGGQRRARADRTASGRHGFSTAGTRASLPSEVEIRLVSGFELLADGRPLAVPLSGQRVIAFLAAQPRPVRRIHVAGSLWTDESDERALGRLRGALFALRHVVDGVVTCVGDQLRLREGVNVDVRTIRAVWDRLDGSGPGRLPLGAIGWLDVLAGDLLPDWSDEWIFTEREQFRQLRLHALEALCTSLSSAGEFAAAIRAGLLAVAADPLRESAHRALVRAYLQEGNPSAAVHQYEIYRQMAAEELGISPTTKLNELLGPYLRNRAK